METVRTQDVGKNDLKWKIEYHAERCTTVSYTHLATSLS